MNTFSDHLLQQMRQQGDPLADEIIQKLFSDRSAAQHFRQLLGKPFQNHTIPAGLPAYLSNFFQETTALPAWTDPILLKKGHQFFESHSREIMSLLGYLSLPYCYAAADGSRVLWMSERIRKNTTVRLAETAQFIFDVMDEQAFEPAGFGIRSIQKVRLVHAAIRYHIRKSNKWNNELWGVPVNQEDMAGTNMAFSVIILRGLRKMGKGIVHEDAEAYLHYWQVIGHLLGIHSSILPNNGKEAFWLTKKIAERTIKPSEEGQALTQALLTSFNEDPPVQLPKGFHESFMRFVLGDQIADIIALPPSNWTSIMVMPQRLVNAVMSAFESNYKRERAKKELAFIKKNTVERIPSDQAFTIPLELNAS